MLIFMFGGHPTIEARLTGGVFLNVHMLIILQISGMGYHSLFFCFFFLLCFVASKEEKHRKDRLLVINKPI